ncbi:hypothetical protein BU17DRAFT_63786 [Hysterangium stoloniferum]|nr:hypothetical protein BU17DRAFT_63786 [Hysterangium stoloniferum]
MYIVGGALQTWGLELKAIPEYESRTDLVHTAAAQDKFIKLPHIDNFSQGFSIWLACGSYCSAGSKITVKHLILHDVLREKDIDLVMEFFVIPSIGVGEDYKHCLIGHRSFFGTVGPQLRSRLTFHVQNGLKMRRRGIEIGIDYSPRKICVGTTVVTGKMPLSFRELHRSGATSYCQNMDPGEAQGKYVIIYLRVLVLNNKTLYSESGWFMTYSFSYLIWWDIFSLAFIDEESIPADSLCIEKVSVLPFCLQKVSAVYGHNNKLRIVLGTSLTLGALASVFVMSVEIPPGLNSSSGGVDYTLGRPGITVTAQRFWFGMLPSLINENILCFLMILKAIQNYRDEYRVPMLTGMIRDRNHVEVQITVVWTTIISCTMGSRLNLTVSTDYQLIKVEVK